MKRLMTLLIWCMLPSVIFAQWPPLSTPNLAVSTTAGNEHNYDATTDGSGGSFVVWEDDRAADNDIYAQRIDNLGVAQWDAAGVPIAVLAGHQHGSKIIDDGSGNAIMCWKDDRGASDDIYAQKIDATGAVQWAANGIGVCTDGSNQDKALIINDGSGGVIIAWQDERSGNKDIYTQKVNSSGVVQWTANGVAICTAAGDQEKLALVGDGSGGAIITWQDDRAGGDIYAQRINSAGVVQWTADGEAICTAASVQANPDITTDNASGAIITWDDKRSGTEDIYAQRINSAGAVQWAANGVAICTAGNKQEEPKIARHMSDGAIIAWVDERGAKDDIYTQRISAAGVVQWAANGVAVSTAADNQNQVVITNADEWNGAFIAWTDKRTGTEDIYAQIVDGSGIMKLAADGLAISTAADKQKKAYIDYLGNGEWLMIWQDERLGNKDLFSQGVNETILGVLPITLSSFDAVLEGQKVKVSWQTATEQNNDYFTIEKSTNGLTFVEIAEVPGAGNSSTSLDYYIYDERPTEGVTYYRLKQTDFNGDFEIFDMVAVNYVKNMDGTCELKVYPNPCMGRCTISLENCQEDESDQMQLEVIDMAGNKVHFHVPNRNSDGSFTYYLDKNNNMAPGVYIVRAASIRENYEKRMMVGG